jgi:hypothetical protein
MLTLPKMGNVVPDFYARGYLEKYRRRPSPGYKRVMRGTLKELIEYVCKRNKGQIGLYRITVGTNTYGGQVIRDLFHSPNFPKSSVAIATLATTK